MTSRKLVDLPRLRFNPLDSPTSDDDRSLTSPPSVAVHSSGVRPNVVESIFAAYSIDLAVIYQQPPRTTAGNSLRSQSSSSSSRGSDSVILSWVNRAHGTKYQLDRLADDTVVVFHAALFDSLRGGLAARTVLSSHRRRLQTMTGDAVDFQALLNAYCSNMRLQRSELCCAIFSLKTASISTSVSQYSYAIVSYWRMADANADNPESDERSVLVSG